MSRNTFRVDFIGIGAEKSGTTWLGQCLSEHPEICFAKNREVYFFNDVDPHYLSHTNTKYLRGTDWYKSQYRYCSNNKQRGEWTITYICTEETAKRIKKLFPKVKLIVCLRNPVDRALSQYLHEIRLGLIKKGTPFEEVIESRPDYIEKGYYAKQLKNYYKYFKKTQLLVLVYEKVKKNPNVNIQKIYDFLELKDNKFVPPSINKKVNIARKAVFPRLNGFMIRTEYFLRANGFDFLLSFFEEVGLRKMALRVRDLNNKHYEKYSKMDDDIQKKLHNIYKDDIEELEGLINHDLSLWKT